VQKRLGWWSYNKNFQESLKSTKDMHEAKARYMHTHPPCIGVKEGDVVLTAECRPISKSVSL